MAGLSNIFGGDDQGSSSNGSFGSDAVADATSTAGLDVSNSSSQESTDEDGNAQSSESNQDLSFDTDTDSLIGSATDAVGTTDQSSSD